MVRAVGWVGSCQLVTRLGRTVRVCPCRCGLHRVAGVGDTRLDLLGDTDSLFLDGVSDLAPHLCDFCREFGGGIGNPLGAVAGGFIVGVLENLVGTYVIGNELKLTFALIIVVGVLTLKPAGLFGRVTVKRV